MSTAIVDNCSPRLVVGIEPSQGFLRTAEKNLRGQAAFSHGTAAHIPLHSASVDRVVSGLVLNFVPNPLAALLEMARVTRPGGNIAAYVWDYAEKMEPIRHFWDAAAEMDPDAARLDEGVRFPLCHPDALVECFENAGFTAIEAVAIDIQATFANFEAYWQPFLGGQGPAPTYAMTLDRDARTSLRDCLQKRIPVQANGSISLVTRAWAIRANRS